MISTLGAKAAIVGGLSLIAKFAKTLTNIQKNDSMVQFTSPLRVEPITLIDKRLERQEYVGDILQSLLSLFCGYYLQAVACMTNVGQVNVIRMLDALNPNRDAATMAGSFVDALNGQARVSMLSMEAYENCALPSLESAAENFKTANNTRAFLRDSDTFAKRQDLHGSVDAKVGDLSKGIKAAQEASNLAVGKMFEVTIENDGAKGVFPISARLATVIVDNEVLTHILGGSGSDNSLRERYWRWKSGELHLLKDLVLCQDLIEQQKKLLMRDKTGAMAEINRRRTMNSAAALTSGIPSVGSASSLIVMSQDSASELERQNQGKLSDVRFRNDIMQNSMAMIIAVVNTDYETVTFYTRGIDLPSKFQIRQLKAANKNGGPDVGELFKMFRAGQQAIF